VLPTLARLFRPVSGKFQPLRKKIGLLVIFPFRRHFAFRNNTLFGNTAIKQTVMTSLSPPCLPPPCSGALTLLWRHFGSRQCMCVGGGGRGDARPGPTWCLCRPIVTLVPGLQLQHVKFIHSGIFFK
jgi:hypothetical protein